MDRGDRREAIFVNDADRQPFLKTLAEACQKQRLASACLLPYVEPFPVGAGNAQRQITRGGTKV